MSATRPPVVDGSAEAHDRDLRRLRPGKDGDQPVRREESLDIGSEPA